MAAWVKSPAAPSAAAETGAIYRGQNFHHHWHHSDPSHRNGFDVKVGGIWYAASFGQLEPDTWYHLAASYDGETLKAYTDGVLTAANTAPSGPPDLEMNPLLFANHTNSFFAGSVDEARVYGRPLSAGEIRSVAGGVYEFTLRSAMRRNGGKSWRSLFGNAAQTRL